MYKLSLFETKNMFLEFLQLDLAKVGSVSLFHLLLRELEVTVVQAASILCHWQSLIGWVCCQLHCGLDLLKHLLIGGKDYEQLEGQTVAKQKS